MSRPRNPLRAEPVVRSARACQGFTYIGLLFIITLMGLVAALAGSTWRFTAQRDRERELLFVGREYQRAIGCHVKAHAAQPQPYPTSLAQMLGSPGELTVRRCLRRLYPDPITDSDDWGLVRTPEGGISGVYSRSTLAPLRQRGVYAGDSMDLSAKSYLDLKFMAATPPAVANGQAGLSEGEPSQPAPPSDYGIDHN
jgi:type II secretory pathway pseudopilin PulG